MICSIFGSSTYFVVYIFRASCHIFSLSYFLNFRDIWLPFSSSFHFHISDISDVPDWGGVLGMQSGTPRHTRIFDKMDIINIITNTYSCSIKAVDTRYGNIIYSTGFHCARFQHICSLPFLFRVLDVVAFPVVKALPLPCAIVNFRPLTLCIFYPIAIYLFLSLKFLFSSRLISSRTCSGYSLHKFIT